MKKNLTMVNRSKTMGELKYMMDNFISYHDGDVSKITKQDWIDEIEHTIYLTQLELDCLSDSDNHRFALAKDLKATKKFLQKVKSM